MSADHRVRTAMALQPRRVQLSVRIVMACATLTSVGCDYVGLGYIGHTLLGNNYIGHIYIGHNYMGHTCIVLSFVPPDRAIGSTDA